LHAQIGLNPTQCAVVIRANGALMTFPVTSREVYKQNFIKEAICQVRFPRLLEIESQLPARFQRLLLRDFPLLASREQFGLSFSPGGSEMMPPSPVRTTIYEFKDVAGDNTVALCSEYVSIVVNRYLSWTHLREHLVNALRAASECYSLPLYTRLGLRYINVVPNLGGSWDETLNPSLVGPLATPQRDNVRAWQSVTSFAVGDDLQLNVMASLGDEAGQSSFVLDLDVFSNGGGEFNADALSDKFDEMNAKVTDAFNWAKAARLDAALHEERSDV
jgi:uncharacterized protein (TIGR04255 family)